MKILSNANELINNSDYFKLRRLLVKMGESFSDNLSHLIGIFIFMSSSFFKENFINESFINITERLF